MLYGKIETEEERYETVQALHGCCLVCLVTEMSNYFCTKHGIYNDTHKLYKPLGIGLWWATFEDGWLRYRKRWKGRREKCMYNVMIKNKKTDRKSSIDKLVKILY